MKNFKIYKNRATKYHPSIELESDGKRWENLEVTNSPTKTNRYIDLDDDLIPDRRGTPEEKKPHVRKFVRNDPIRTRGELMDRYHLSERDLQKIEDFLIEHQHNKKKS